MRSDRYRNRPRGLGDRGGERRGGDLATSSEAAPVLRTTPAGGGGRLQQGAACWPAAGSRREMEPAGLTVLPARRVFCPDLRRRWPT